MKVLMAVFLFTVSVDSTIFQQSVQTACLKNVSRPTAVLKNYEILLNITDDLHNKSMCILKYEEVEQLSCCDGFLEQHGECYPVCKDGCLNGQCTGPNQCSCLPGFQKIGNDCKPSCYKNKNGECSTIPQCQCKEGHIQDSKGTCVPQKNCIAGIKCINGRCNRGACSCDKGFKLSKTNKNECVPKCSSPCVNGYCSAPNECSCSTNYKKSHGHPNVCLPVCNPPCFNGDCIAPNHCVCKHGYGTKPSKHDRTCTPICDPKYADCTNGRCVEPNRCECDAGYVFHNTSCVPHCDPPCVNGYCSGPDQCSCKPGYKNSIKNQHDCIPICDSKYADCTYGSCVEPNRCECNSGYVFHDNSCVPYCNPACINGRCIAPNQCDCETGYIEVTSSGNCTPVCDSIDCANGECKMPNLCDCNEGYVFVNKSCTPYCASGCIKSTCLKPNECTCDEGFEPSELKHICIPTCDPPCENGECTDINTCSCYRGYSKSRLDSFRCNPLCNSTYFNASNGNCLIPNVLECNQNYSLEYNGTLNKFHCKPTCDNCPNEELKNDQSEDTTDDNFLQHCILTLLILGGCGLCFAGFLAIFYTIKYHNPKGEYFFEEDDMLNDTGIRDSNL